MTASPDCRFTVLGHACLAVEAGDLRIVVDPWLFGSCYWRSWWHYPAPPEVSEEWWHPDVVIASHHHADHLHYPTVRRFDRAARIAIPRFGVDVMAPEFETMGFTDITEVPHGTSVVLAPGVRYASYQYGFDDSVVVLEVGDTVLVDCNDAKIRGRALKQVADDFGRPTFAFKTHSYAQAFPLSYTADDSTDLDLVTPETFLADFVETATTLRPQHMVPFASDVAFLHPQSRHANEHTVTRTAVAAAMAVHGPDDVRVLDMRPGESWSSAGGFEFHDERLSEDLDTRRRVIAARSEEVALTLRTQADHEADVDLDFDTFRAYFEAFVRAVPFPARRLAGGRPVVFEAPWHPSPAWVVDLRGRRVYAAAEVPDHAASVVVLDRAVLAEGIANRILHFAQGSFRQRTHVRAGGLGDDLAFWALVMIYEIGYLPLRASVRPRLVRASLRRWRELLDAASALTRRGGGSPLERLAGGFATQPPDDSTVGTAPG
ncbi:MAG: MBL fold metallo-hydrolase [Acidimicrobiales bacterium]